MRALLRPLPRAVTRPVSVLLLLGWVAVMAILINRSYLQASTSLATDLVRSALATAFLHRRPPAGLLYHSERGVQYACGDFSGAFAVGRLVARMSRKGKCYDNATMESFWSSFKRACADGTYPTRRDGTTAAFDSIETFYNRVRLNSALPAC